MQHHVLMSSACSAAGLGGRGGGAGRAPGCVVGAAGSREAKDGFGAWKKMADAENIEKCKRIWDEYDADGSGTMDLGEINAVLEKLRSMGFNPVPISEADMVRLCVAHT